MDVRRSRNIKHAEAMFIKLGLHMLSQQLAATTPTKPRKKGIRQMPNHPERVKGR
jgi:hypothetical protein